MILSRQRAKELISSIVDRQQPVKTGATLPIRPGVAFNVYRIPIEYLVPNQDNDRITWKIREYEAEHQRRLNIENEDDVIYIYSLIEDESQKENDATLKDLAYKGQQVDGVITNTGIIIDGNRRATLLRKLYLGAADRFNKNVEEFHYFNCIVLPGDMQRREIMALETMLQIGVDEKVNYNRICLYIKIDNLLQANYTHTQIKQYMNLKAEKDVEKMKDIYDLMVKYLDSIGKSNHFTLLDGLEDQFIQTNALFKQLDNGSYSTEWDPTDSDKNDFKAVCFDYMRAKFEGKKYRTVLLGKTQKTDGIFIDENVWKDFLARHEQIMDENDPQSEHDWQYLGRSGGPLDVNLNIAAEEIHTLVNEKDLRTIINDLRKKIAKLNSFVQQTNVGNEEKEEIKKAADDLRNIVSLL